MIPERILALGKSGALNMHGSVLPRSAAARP
jgi:methionyl-tRNA formyltransferase